MSTGKQFGIMFIAFMLIVMQAVSLAYMPGSAANPDADTKYKNLTTADIKIPVILSVVQFILLLAIMGLGYKLFPMPKVVELTN